MGAVAGGEDLGEGDRPSPSEAVDNGLGEGSTYGENRWLLGFPPVSDGDLGERDFPSSRFSGSILQRRSS